VIRECTPTLVQLFAVGAVAAFAAMLFLAFVWIVSGKRRA
jgi:hypothetical protein